MKSWGRGFLVVFLGGWIAVAFAGSAAAQSIPHIVPPPGTPDLSQMVLQPGDFSHPGPIQQEGYERPSVAAVTASYFRVFGPSTSGQTTLADVASEADLFSDTPTATTFLRILKRLERTRQGQRALLEPFVQRLNRAAGRTVVRFRDVHVHHVHSLSVGDGSVFVPATIVIDGLDVSVDIVQVRVDRALGEIVLSAVGRLRTQDALTLARAIAQHMRSVLTSASPSSAARR
jgi:hypothetical protein